MINIKLGEIDAKQGQKLTPAFVPVLFLISKIINQPATAAASAVPSVAA